MPQLRQNIITGEWVVIAPERSRRPDDFAKIHSRLNKQIAVVEPKTCVFCPTGAEFKRRFKESDTKTNWVIPNKYPAFKCDEKQISTRSFYPEHSFFRAKAAIGEHDIVVVKDHNLSLPSFSLAVWQDLLETIQVRMVVHHQNRAVEQIMPIYNHKPEAGASIAHPHAQIFSGPVVPNAIAHETDGALRYFNNNGFCVFCDLAAHEKKEKLRLIEENDHFIAFTFYAARFPFEVWILPKIHEANFETVNKAERKSLSLIVQNSIARISKLLADPPLNWWIHSLPTIESNSDYYHWHLEIAPRITGYGGFEMGADMVIDVQSPEEAAELLRAM